MKLLIWSDSVCASTGFARAAKTICAALPDWDITQVGINHPSKLIDHPYVRIYPTTNDDPGGAALARELYLERDFDLFIILQDLHVTHQAAGMFEKARGLRERRHKKPCPVLYHFPVDGPMLDDTGFMAFADYNISCTRWGVSVLRPHIEQMSYASPEPVFVQTLPYSTDPKVFAPMLEDERLALRAKLFGISPGDPTLAIMVIGTNIGRKDLFTSLRALKLSNEESPRGKMYLHTRPEFSGLSIWSQARALGLSQLSYQVADPSLIDCNDETLNQYYNVADVLLSTARREGFGIPVIEAMAAGTLVLAPDYGPFKEILCGGKYGLLHQTHGLTHWARGDNRGPGWQSSAETVALHLAHIQEGLKEAPEAYEKRRHAARQHVIDNYSEDVVEAKWQQVIGGICHGS